MQYIVAIVSFGFLAFFSALDSSHDRQNTRTAAAPPIAGAVVDDSGNAHASRTAMMSNNEVAKRNINVGMHQCAVVLPNGFAGNQAQIDRCGALQSDVGRDKNMKNNNRPSS